MKLHFWAVCLTLGSAVVAPVLPGCTSKTAQPIWDLPSVIGQPIGVVKKTLGVPQSESSGVPGLMQSRWTRDEITLSATWKSSSGRVTAYELVSRSDSKALREGETAALLLPGRLQESDPRYSTEWVEAASRPLFYTGVKIVPAPKNHGVTVRVTGSEALLQVAYQIGSPGGKSDNFLTIAPWEAVFTLPDDATIALSAGLYKSLSRKPLQWKAEIIADGRVVASAASTGQTVQCNFEL